MFMTAFIKNSAVVHRIVCAVLFLIFTFLYVYSYQVDILAATQHVLSGGVTHYDRTVGAILITAVLFCLHLVIYGVSRLNGVFHALTYLPSLLLVGLLTDVDTLLLYGRYPLFWLWFFPLLMLVYGWVIWIGRQYESVQRKRHNFRLRPLWLNLLTMLLMFLMTGCIGSNDKVLHYRAHMEHAYFTHRSLPAIETGRRDAVTDSSLTLLRIWALTEQKQLGSRLFTFPLAGGSEAMLPNGRSVRLLMVPEAKLYKALGGVVWPKMTPKKYLTSLHHIGKATPMAHDWLLCAHLLDGDIDAFVRDLPRYYPINAQLPKHYREALILYAHQRHQPVIVYREAVMDADYEDFRLLRTQIKEKKAKKSDLKSRYGKTFWYYYETL